MLTSHGRHRYEELDSLRGVAAMIVVLGHALNFWNEPYPRWWSLFRESPLGLLIDGPDAVYIFFVLSGFVLFLPYIREEGPEPYGRYLVKRVCRIYLPYLAGLALAIIADRLFYRPLGGLFPKWDQWNSPPEMHAVWQHILFITSDSMNEFSISFWTLAFEMRLSILFPLVAYLALRMQLVYGVLAGLAVCAGGFYLADALQTPYWQTAGYGGVFVLGAVIARHLPKIRALLEKHGAVGSTVVLLLAIFLFKSTHLLPARLYVWWTLVPLHSSGAALILVLAMTAVSFKSFLHTTALRWLGKVSYSLYLVHCTVLYSLATLYWQRTSHHILLMAGGILLSLLLAEVLYRWVERPSILLGRRLTRATG